jgi:hypothetical protein
MRIARKPYQWITDSIAIPNRSAMAILGGIKSVLVAEKVIGLG